MPKPGVMLYFDIRPCLKRLTVEQKGQLFEAILEYGEFGVAPDFDADIGLAVAWDLIRPMIDRDNERYEKISKRRSEAACKRWGTNNANASNSIQVDANDTNASGCMQVIPTTPTTTTTPTPTTTPTTTTTTTATTATTPLSYGEPKNPAMNAVAAGFEDLRRARLEKLNTLSGKK